MLKILKTYQKFKTFKYIMLIYCKFLLNYLGQPTLKIKINFCQFVFFVRVIIFFQVFLYIGLCFIKKAFYVKKSLII